MLSRILLYVRDIEMVRDFYVNLFGFRAHQETGDRIVELIPKGAGAHIMLHPAAKGQKQGQAQAKLVFQCDDVAAFCAAHADIFGKIHQADGYQFANGKDPAGNSIQVTTRPLL